MHALPRQTASRAVTTRSLAAASTFVCPSCAGGIGARPAKTTTTALATARRHLATTPARRNTAAATSTTSASNTSPASISATAPPSAGFARLTSRRLISIAGVDAAKFLQGIVTASTINRSEGFYTGFLNATGRVLHDVWIYPDTLRVGAARAEGEAFLIEVDAEQADTLLRHLKRYRLRSKFQLAPVEEGECGVWQVWNDDDNSSGGGAFAGHTTSTASPARIILPDTRAPGLGHRVLSTAPASQVASELTSLLGLPSSPAAAGDDEAYRIRRYLLGVPEGQREIPRESSLPLEANMDLMGGIDFRKGCYVGQELTIRTKHRGVVRKRILPCVLYHGSAAPERLEYDPSALSAASSAAGGVVVAAAEDIPQGSPIAKDAARKGRGAGTWLRGVGNIGLALCRLQVMTDVELPGEAAAGGGGLAPFDPSAEFVVRIDVEAAEGNAGENDGGSGEQQQKQVKIKAFVPPWLRQRLDEANAPKH